MLVAAVVVPGPPALVPELMGAAAHELDGLRHAADQALRVLVADLVAASGSSPAQLVVAGPTVTPHPRAAAEADVVGSPRAVAEFDARGPVDFAEFGRAVMLPALPGAVGAAAAPLPTSLMVARYLAYRACGPDDAQTADAQTADAQTADAQTADAQTARVWSTARWVTTDAETAARLGSELRNDAGPAALVLIADGATCHGPKAPRAEDSRAGAYEESVWEALASGDPDSLGRIDSVLATELGANGPQLWPALQTAAAGQQWHAELLWRGAPYGVGGAVALWRREG